jgi:subtilisin family serine protease
MEEQEQYNNVGNGDGNPAIPDPYQSDAHAQQTEITNMLNSTLPILNTTQTDTSLAGVVIPGQYIVLLKENATNSRSPQTVDALFEALNQTVQALGANVIREYKDVGILVIQKSNEQSSNITTVRPSNLVDQLKSDPNVLDVVPNVTVIVASPNVAVGNATSQTLPTGIDRVDGDLSYTKSGDGSGNVDVDIAILDSGVNKHRDLNVYTQTDYFARMGTGTCQTCPPSSIPVDNGHGTHVAGIAAAKDNLEGVVGVAPGARIWSVKVSEVDGKSNLDSVIAGVRYVTEHADEIDVANLSLGFLLRYENIETVKSFMDEIHKSVNAGVVYVAAAMNGNFPGDASLWVPAAFPDVISVSAISDSDGKCGGVGLPITVNHRSIRIIDREVVPILVPVINPDDSFASYSNYGAKINIAAPGTHIYSTHLDNGYAYLDGTSMASPHVAGAAALYKAIHPDATPLEVLDALINLGSTPDSVCDANGHGYFTGDPDGTPERLLYLKNIGKSIDLTIHVPYPFPFKIIPGEVPPGGPIPPTPPQANITEIIASRPSNGTLSISQDSGALDYTPNPDFYGEDSFTFTVNGTEIATVTIVLNNPSSAPATQPQK